MIPILTPDQMRKADARAINELKIPGIVLMENAARSASEVISDILGKNKSLKVAIFCGSGNNGGDGFAIARQLYDKYNVCVYCLGKKEAMTDETLANFHAVEKIGIPITQIQSEYDLENYSINQDCIVDALIGVGGSENLRGTVVPLLKLMNDTKAIKVAIDAPTGLNTETGVAHQDCFTADYTVTMFAVKTGMLCNDGMEKCGKISLAYLGAPVTVASELSNNAILEKEDILNILPIRKRISSKFDYGRIIVIAGSESYPGAAALSANSCISSGAGLVSLYTSKIHHSLMPDVIPYQLPKTRQGSISMEALDILNEAIEKADTAIIGPGLGDEDETIALIKEILLKSKDELNIIIDADGLRAIGKNAKLRKNIILTPHAGEFSKLTGIPRADVERNSFRLAKEWADRWNCTLLLKNVPTIISNGSESYWNIWGNPGMSVGGSGDVLSGIIGAMSGIGLKPFEAASVAAYLHSLAGDLYASKFSQETLTASALTDFIKEAFVHIYQK